MVWHIRRAVFAHAPAPLEFLSKDNRLRLRVPFEIEHAAIFIAAHRKVLTVRRGLEGVDVAVEPPLVEAATAVPCLVVVVRSLAVKHLHLQSLGLHRHQTRRIEADGGLLGLDGSHGEHSTSWRVDAALILGNQRHSAHLDAFFTEVDVAIVRLERHTPKAARPDGVLEQLAILPATIQPVRFGSEGERRHFSVMRRNLDCAHHLPLCLTRR